MNKLVALGAGILLLGGAAQATTITWGDVMDYALASDVSTEGTLVEAINGCGIADLTSPLVNGVQFAASTTLMSGDASVTFFYGDTGDSEYNDLLNTLDYGSSSIEVGNGLLEVGKKYQIQIWFVDERGSQDARAMQFGDGTGNLSGEVNDQYVTGIFIAEGTSQTITINGVDSVTPHISAYQVRDLNSPVATLSSTVGSTVSGNFTVAVNFSVDVVGLVTADFTVVNGTASSISGSGANWSVNISPSSNGDVSVTLPAGSVTNAGGHSNSAANTITTTYVAPGSEQPVPSLSTSAAEVYGDYTVQVDFSETVTGLELSDFIITNGTVSSLTGAGSNYSVVVSPTEGGDVTVVLSRNSVTDMDGDTLQNVASSELVTAHYMSVSIHSLPELLTYVRQDNINAVMTPGTYTITAADVAGGMYEDYTLILGRNYKTLLLFSGNNSTYNFAGVTLHIETGVWHDNDYGNNGVYELQTTGNNNVLKNLTMVDVGTVNDDPRDGCVNIVMDGQGNRIEGFHLTIKGSYPYGYGDCFGKGGSNNTIPHDKHSAFLIRGESNHAKNCTLIHRSYGHAMFMQAASNPIIEGCYIEGEMRSTDDMLAETSGPAYDIDFMTTWGYRLPPGYMKSTGEGGIRAYNAGETVIDGVEYDRGTSNPTIINNTVVNMRTGVTLTHASGTKYVAGCKTIGCERGYAIGSGIIENCSGDVQYGPVFGVDYESDRGVTADITILPYEGDHYNGSRHFAYIYGSDHNLTFRGMDANPDQTLEINVGGDKRIESNLAEIESLTAEDIVINNLTGYPLILDTVSSGITGQSIGTRMNNGSGNSMVERDWSVTSNVTFYGTATQSSSGYGAIASVAIDQNTSGSFGDGSVTHTDNEAQPWWRIDLGGPFDISEIRIWGRDSNKDRLSNYDVTILDKNEQPVWTTYQANYPDLMVSLNSGSVTGQYVMVQLRGTDPLSLAEVEIYGISADDSRLIDVFTTASANAPTVSSADLAQTHYLNSSATGGNDAALHAELFNGQAGNDDEVIGDSGEVRLTSDNTVTVTFDTSVHTNGYDLTGINTYFGWNPSDEGRSNQGYEIILTFMDDSTETLAGPKHWEPNAPTAYYWTTVFFKEEAGGVMASGVKAVTFDVTEDANAGGVVVAREIDVFGEPTLTGAIHRPAFSPGFTVSNGHINTSFSGSVGEHYRMECTQSLSNSGTWQVVTDIVSLANSPYEMSTPATNDTCFYRLLWLP